MTNFWKTAEFKALQRDWYKRLKDEGFRDAESEVDGDLVLDRSSQHVFQGMSELTILARQTYYALLGQCVESHTFTDIVDKMILTWHAQGKKIKEICKSLEAQGERRARNTVRFIIRRYEIAWGLKKYKPTQLNKYPPKPIR